jgi:threonyl-tRNA synthetase
MDEELQRHSCAHVMAHAIQKIWPDARFGIGPTIESGFYYDIALSHTLAPEDLPKIEKEMRNIIKHDQPFIRKEHTIEEAIDYFKGLNQNYKVEIIENLRDRENAKTVSTYSEGKFTDLCRGPHVEKAGQIGAFKLTSIAGAYWRGDEKRDQLQRIYGVAFQTQAELEEHLRLLEEAKKRDHRKLGKELDLFSFHPEAPSMPFFHPKGTILYNRLTKYIRDLYQFGCAYDEIITPQILDVKLWHQSGHYDNYRDSMYFTEIDERQFAVKPMNCPASTFVFSSQKRSYRDLPLRFADFGRLHRYERSGVTAGLTRVRSFCQDDAHIFCSPDQVEPEINNLIQMILKTFELFEFTDLKVFLSTRPEKRVGSDEVWNQAETALEKVLKNSGRPYQVNPGDGAFYGPKIDFMVSDALKRKHQLATIQLDFNLGERFKLEYTGADNKPHTPIVVHRAILGSLERFLGVYIEHVAGAFPFWLAPTQARLIPIKDAHNSYCQEFLDRLAAMGYRMDQDSRNESMGLKTRDSQKSKIPFSLVAGDREMAEGKFAVRKYGEMNSTVMTQTEILELFARLEALPHEAIQKVKNALA